MSDVNDDWHKKIASYFKNRGISANSVEKECGLGSGTFAKFLRGYSDIGASKLRKIILHYNIDANLLFKDINLPVEPPPGKIYNNSIHERFNELIAEIRHFEPFDNDTQIAKKIGINASILADYKAGKLNFTIEFLSKVLSTFVYLDGSTFAWLMTGKGKIINDRPVRIKLDVEKGET